MKWVLIILVINNPTAWTEKYERMELAVFPDEAHCLEAAKNYSYNHPICGIKEAINEQ